MKKTQLTVSFQLKKTKKGRDGKTPIYLRITVEGKRFEVATGKRIEEKQWGTRMQRAKGKSESAQIINNYLVKKEDEVNKYYLKIDDGEKHITVDDFKSKFQSGRGTAFTLIQVFKENNKLVKMEIGNKYSESTYNQYVTTFNRLKAFLKKHYHITDIELSKLDVNFMSRFDNFLRLEYGIGVNTIAKYLKQLKKVVHYAQRLRYLNFDPFDGYKISYKEVDRGYLTGEELKRIEEKTFRIKRLEEVKDVFLFVCYTGLSYSDLKALTNENIFKTMNRRNCIKYERKKTSVRATVPLLSSAQAILDKYGQDPECIAYGKILPVKSNQRLNSYLAEIAELCEIDKHITMHLGRHTFATTVAFEKGVPIESVQHMLAHKNLSTTQIYSRMTDPKVMEDMNKLDEKLLNINNGAIILDMKKIV